MRANELATRHLLLRMLPVNRALRAAVQIQSDSAARLDRPDLKSLCVTDAHVASLLTDVDQFLEWGGSAAGPGLSLTTQERQHEAKLRRQAADDRFDLPLDILTKKLQLEDYEIAALLICAAPELHPAYERIFGFVLDDLNRRFPCVELVCRLTSQTSGEYLQRRNQLGPFGRLSRCGLLEPFGESTLGARTRLRVTTGVLEFLCGLSSDMAATWRDPLEVNADSGIDDVVTEDRKLLERIGMEMADRAVAVIGLWGTDRANPQNAAEIIARSAGLSLRRLQLACCADKIPNEHLRNEIRVAAALNSVLLVDTNPLQEVENRKLAVSLVQELANCEGPAIFTGETPWRPTELLARRAWLDLQLHTDDQRNRALAWSTMIPEMKDRASDFASRYRMSHEEIRAVRGMAAAHANVETNGQVSSIEDHLEDACVAVAQRTRGRYAGLVQPKRGPDDLVLPPAIYRQVMEIAEFTRVLPAVAETWGFGRLATGGSGLKCLFGGDPGTGKTLAAEVIAGQVGTPMLKVNIAEIVSKWVGETEKNLDAAFREAASSHAVLFFDEADALFGKRGKVEHGVDRYANLEVSHLLQRLEEHEGLVILATNLKDNIDHAFLRRFHVVLHFPRPGEAERRRIWNLAFPAQAPLDAEIDFSTLVRLDLTGAGIVGAARTAALLAANEQTEKIDMSHVVRGIARQFQRESRILSTSDLGPYANLLQSHS